MRIYGSIQISFWENSDIQILSDQSKLLAIYLLTGPHSNMLGCYRLPDGYINEDLKWTNQHAKDAFCQLTSIDFLTRDVRSSWVVIHDFLKWNPVQNPKQGAGVQKLFNLVPPNETVYIPLVKGLLTHGRYLDKEFQNRLNKLMTSLTNRLDTICSTHLTDKEQDKDQDQDTKRLYSLREYVVGDTDNPVSTHSIPCPQEKIIELYHDILPMCPRVLIWNRVRRKYLKCRWNENPKHQTLKWWSNYFNHVKQFDFLIGKKDGQNGKPPFVADLEWLIRSSNFTKVIEGKYDEGRL
jgi:hypothetical protein